MNKHIYLSNASHYYQILPCVYEKTKELIPFMANPQSTHDKGSRIYAKLEQAREDIARIVNCDSSNIIFTSGASEGNWLAVDSFKRLNGRLPTISKFEHPSLGRYGDLHYSHSPDFVTAVSNITGDRLYGCIPFDNVYHSDLTSALGNVNIDLSKLKIQTATASAEKIGSYSGSGILYVKDMSLVDGLWHGGTPNVLGAICMAEALKESTKEIERKYWHCLKLKEKFIDELDKAHIDFMILQSTTNTVPSIFSVAIKDIDSVSLLNYLDFAGIYADSGSACESKNLEPSKVLKALGVPEDYIKGTIRISTSLNNTVDEIKYTVEKIKEYIELVG